MDNLGYNSVRCNRNFVYNYIKGQLVIDRRKKGNTAELHNQNEDCFFNINVNFKI